MVVGLVLDGSGRPVCCELWPGNTTDVKTLLPVADRLRSRFGIDRVCVVADAGMISAETKAELEARGWNYILGARMRRQKEVRDEVLSRAGRYRVVRPERERAKDPSPLKVKEVRVQDRRYVVCVNEEHARKDAHDREAILTTLREHLRRGDKSLVGNKGYRRYLASRKEGFSIDEKKVALDARYDGKWVLSTNLDNLDAAQVALQYKQLWMVEDLFRTAKAVLDTRPIYHQCDRTIRGHVFCTFLALILRKALQDALDAHGHDFEWDDVLCDLEDLVDVHVLHQGKHFVLRTGTRGTSGKVFQSVGVALPPTVRQLEAN
jgi:transposase